MRSCYSVMEKKKKTRRIQYEYEYSTRSALTTFDQALDICVLTLHNSLNKLSAGNFLPPVQGEFQNQEQYIEYDKYEARPTT